MNLKEKILKTEIEFPKIFTSYIEKAYGIIYFNTENKESHDSNHAILYPDKIFDIEYVLCDIKNFYLDKGITPRIYQPTVTGYFEKHREVLESLGYKVEMYGNNRYMLLTEENYINVKKTLAIKRLLEWDERIANDIFIPNGEEYEIDVLKNSLKYKNTYLFVGYLNNIAAATTYFHISENDCTRFDYIIVAKDHRNHGYARELLGHAVDYCRENNINNCYQCPAHKTSERICYEAGFRVVFEAEAGAAVYQG